MPLHKTACILCSLNCGLEIETDAGRITKVRGDPLHPSSRGYICNKAARLDYYQNHAERLSHPLKRHDDGSFARISWDQATAEIAAELTRIRAVHGRQLLAAMGSRFAYSALAQEKTGDFWVNGRLFGAQNCHPSEDIDHADYVLFIGCNPFHSHGIARARDQLKALKRDPARTMAVIDPRRTETAEMADIHLQLRPGTDAFLLLAMLAFIVREGLHDQHFIDAHCTGFDAVRDMLMQVPIDEYLRVADVSPDVVKTVRADPNLSHPAD